MRFRTTTLTGIMATFALVMAAAWPTGTMAGLDISFGADLQIGDDTDVYLSVSSRYFDQDEGRVRKWNGRCHDPDDLAVVLFLARHGHQSPDQVFRLRSQGKSWWEISLQLGVPANQWFVPVKKDPGPPYGKAYGHYKKHGKKSPERMVLSDDDARNLVSVRLLHDYFDISVEAAMDMRSSGRNLNKLTASEYRIRHGNKKGKVAMGSMGGGFSKGGQGESGKIGKKGKK